MEPVGRCRSLSLVARFGAVGLYLRVAGVFAKMLGQVFVHLNFAAPWCLEFYFSCKVIVALVSQFAL
jgi:hypothetical protein